MLLDISKMFRKARKNIFHKIFAPQPGENPPDYFLIAIFGLLVVFGLIMLSSASSVVGYQKFGSTYYYLWHQILFGLVPGLILFYVFFKIDYHFWRKWSLIILLASIGLLFLVFIPGLGATYGRAKSWINIGDLSLQPSEIIKLTLIIYLAAWFEIKDKHELKHFGYGFIPFAILLGIIMLLIALQPDIGTMGVIVLIALTIFFVAGGRLVHIFWSVIFGFAFLAILIFQASYRMNRLMTFLHPELDPQGVGYHINQAILAIGSGGLFGRGFGKSIQKFAYLPEVTGDSIFAIIGEELGFLFSAGLVILFLALAIKGFKLAQKAPDDFAKYLIIGIVSWFVIQAFLNIASMVGLAPMTGIPLPFISYGGTALMTSLAAAGLLINISKQVWS